MYYFYVIISQKDGKLYKGITNNIDRRLRDHNSGKTISTRNRKPFELVYKEEFQTRQEALKREKYYKTYSGGLRLKQIINRV